MITLNDGREIEIISIHNRQVDFRVLNRTYSGIYVMYAAVADPAEVPPLPDDYTEEDIVARSEAMQAALEAAIVVAEPIIKSVLDNPPISDNRIPSARDKAIIDNLPSWSVVEGKFDSMLADAKAATNLAQAKAVLIELIKTQKKMARVLYWEIKNVEE